MTKNHTKLGKKIYDFRIKKYWSQQRIATFLGVSKTSINRWENGKTNPSDITIARISDLLDQSSAAA